MVKDELSTNYAKFLTEFRKFREYHLRKKGIDFCNLIKLNLNYYHAAERDANNTKIKGKPKFILGDDDLLFGFNSIYQEN